jgi:hypothetical protein
MNTQLILIDLLLVVSILVVVAVMFGAIRAYIICIAEIKALTEVQAKVSEIEHNLKVAGIYNGNKGATRD